MLALLTIMAVAFLASSTSERATARASFNKTKADLAAHTAVNIAIARLLDNLSQYPDSATSWEAVNGTNSGTVLYFRDKTPEIAAAAGAPAQLNVLPLISGGTVQPVATKNTSLAVLNNTNSYDLNHARFSGDTQGWIGAPLGATSPPEYRGQWTDLPDSDGKVTSRYAFWMEDESFKANANLMSNTVRGSTSLGAAPTEVPFQGIIKVALSSSDPNTVASDILTLRNKFPGNLFYEYRALNQVKDQPILGDSLKFSSTIYSGTLNLSRNGAKRVNLNKIVADSTDPTAIRKQLDQITKTISSLLPNFAQRFYRAALDKNTLDVSSSGSPSHQTIYLNKIAANIRDYLDTDSQPTIVNNDSGLTVRIGSAPTNALVSTGGGTAGLNEAIAIGQERVPRIQEYAYRVREIVFDAKTGPLANYTIAIDHYIEVWNTYNRDILLSELGTNPFLLIANQPGWDAGSFPGIPESPARDLKLYLSNAKNSATNASLTSFPAGSVTVLTTDPTLLPALTPDSSRVFFLQAPPALRQYSGQTDRKNSNNQLRLNMIDRTTSSSDYETEIVLGNNLGILESAWGAGAIGSAISINVDDGTAPTGAGTQKLNDTKYHFRGASLRGNNASSPLATTGDPRTNAEQIRFDLNGATASNDKTRYFASGLQDNSIPGNSTLGAPNSNFVIPANWPDYSSDSQAAANAPAVVENSSLTSVGQLGNIFDPVKTKGDSNDITLSRSGGRTLKIGQPDRYDATTNPTGLWDGNSNSASREWTAWRLADVFATTDVLQLDGRININGVARDNGTALKTALYGYVFRAPPDSDPNLSGQGFDADPTNTSDKINELIKQILARLKNDSTAAVYGGQFGTTAGPFAERGELSEMPIFNTGTDLVSGVNTATSYDRGREELFRRLAELITTRGNIFTVYAVGQSLNPQSGGASPIVTSTAQLKVTFRIDPVWNVTPPTDPSWDPTLSADVTKRFKTPDKYAIKILYAGD